MNDATRAAMMALAQSIVNLLVLLKVFELDAAQLGAVNLVLNNGVLLFALLYKKGQQAGPTT
jgi:hypothetical protein